MGSKVKIEVEYFDFNFDLMFYDVIQKAIHWLNKESNHEIQRNMKSFPRRSSMILWTILRYNHEWDII